MNENLVTGPPKRQQYQHTTEYIDAETGEYVKENYLKTHKVKLWLRLCQKWIHLCKEDQDKIYNTIINAPHVILGNNDYAPPVELRIEYEAIDDSWTEIDRRKATRTERKTLKVI